MQSKARNQVGRQTTRRRIMAAAMPLHSMNGSFPLPALFTRSCCFHHALSTTSIIAPPVSGESSFGNHSTQNIGDRHVKLQMKRVALVERIPVGECGGRYRDKAPAVVASIILVLQGTSTISTSRELQRGDIRGHYGMPLCEFASNGNNRENIKTGNCNCIVRWPDWPPPKPNKSQSAHLNMQVQR